MNSRDWPWDHTPLSLLCSCERGRWQSVANGSRALLSKSFHFFARIAWGLFLSALRMEKARTMRSGFQVPQHNLVPSTCLRGIQSLPVVTARGSWYLLWQRQGQDVECGALWAGLFLLGEKPGGQGEGQLQSQGWREA